MSWFPKGKGLGYRFPYSKFYWETQLLWTNLKYKMDSSGVVVSRLWPAGCIGPTRTFHLTWQEKNKNAAQWWIMRPTLDQLLSVFFSPLHLTSIAASGFPAVSCGFWIAWGAKQFPVALWAQRSPPAPPSRIGPLNRSRPQIVQCFSSHCSY